MRLLLLQLHLPSSAPSPPSFHTPAHILFFLRIPEMPPTKVYIYRRACAHDLYARFFKKEVLCGQKLATCLGLHYSHPRKSGVFWNFPFQGILSSRKTNSASCDKIVYACVHGLWATSKTFFFSFDIEGYRRSARRPEWVETLRKILIATSPLAAVKDRTNF